MDNLNTHTHTHKGAPHRQPYTFPDLHSSISVREVKRTYYAAAQIQTAGLYFPAKPQRNGYLRR